MTPLHVAAEKGFNSDNIMEHLVEKKADINIKDNNGVSICILLTLVWLIWVSFISRNFREGVHLLSFVETRVCSPSNSKYRYSQLQLSLGVTFNFLRQIKFQVPLKPVVAGSGCHLRHGTHTFSTRYTHTHKIQYCVSTIIFACEKLLQFRPLGYAISDG